MCDDNENNTQQNEDAQEENQEDLWDGDSPPPRHIEKGINHQPNE